MIDLVWYTLYVCLNVHLSPDDAWFRKSKHVVVLVCFTNKLCIVFDCLYLFKQGMIHLFLYTLYVC
jgi:hypothetical protein